MYRDWHLKFGVSDIKFTASLSMKSCGGSMCDFCISDMFSTLREITNVKRNQQLNVNCTYEESNDDDADNVDSGHQFGEEVYVKRPRQK